MISKLLTVREVASILACSVRTARNLIASGQLACIRVGRGRGVLRVPESELTRWIQDRLSEAKEGTKDRG